MNKQNVKSVVAVLRSAASSVSAVLTAEEKAKYLASLLGSVIATTLDMPSTAVDIPRNFFLTNHKQRVTEFVCEVNELFPINVDLAISLADNIFMTRYRLVFEGPFMLHMLTHLAKCSDDTVPSDISNILCKVSDAKIGNQDLKYLIGNDASTLFFNLR